MTRFSKRNAKSQNAIEEAGYETKSQPNTTPTSQHSMFGETTTYPQRPYAGADQNTVKRQRVSADFGTGSYDRDQWSFSSAPNSAGLYPPSHTPVSAYSQDAATGSHQVPFAYRAHTGETSLMQTPSSTSFHRGGVAEYGQGQQQMNYEPRGGYGQHDSPTGKSNYAITT